MDGEGSAGAQIAAQGQRAVDLAGQRVAGRDGCLLRALVGAQRQAHQHVAEIFLCLGVVGEYVAKIYLEVKRRPRYLIERLTGDRDTIIARRDKTKQQQ